METTLKDIDPGVDDGFLKGKTLLAAENNSFYDSPKQSSPNLIFLATVVIFPKNIIVIK